MAHPHVKASTARREASKLLTKPHIAAELARRRADVAARNGIKLDDIVQILKVQMRIHALASSVIIKAMIGSRPANA